MLERSDAEIVKAWFIAALDEGKQRGLSASELAQLCNVTPQAVNGWRSTGRMTKKNLEIAAGYFGHRPSFTSTGPKTSEPSAHHGHAWPFKRISADRFEKLGHAQRERIETFAEGVLSEFEAASKKKKSG